MPTKCDTTQVWREFLDQKMETYTWGTLFANPIDVLYLPGNWNPNVLLLGEFIAKWIYFWKT